MKQVFSQFLLLSLVSGSALALTPSPKLVEISKVGFVSNFRNATGTIDLSQMPSDYSYADLTQEELKSLEKVYQVKQEFGKMFGFNDWKVTTQKFIDRDSQRTFLIEGTYKTESGKPVSFIEVYWASKTDARQFLITSEKQSLNLNTYQEFFVQ